ncbi:hypothetical protein BKA62DRAFT_696780 [Auriculariales sp. MPI-PUGE-AT-0066]|nr:hypothetical protein BKA62DRAFT_696780 [Auriculariales sp. MPI-PUGE-AT-0066]
MATLRLRNRLDPFLHQEQAVAKSPFIAFPPTTSRRTFCLSTDLRPKMLLHALGVTTVAATVALAHAHGHGDHRHRDINPIFADRDAERVVARAPGDTTSGTTTTTTIAAAPTTPTTTPVTTTPAAPTAPTTPTTSTTPVVTPSTTVPPVVGVPTITPAANAMPLNQIVPNGATPATSKLPATQAGAKPSGLPSAPALPDISKWSALNYPKADVVPATDTAEVIEWIQAVRDSGIIIPEIKPHPINGENDCQIAENMPRVGNLTECWWTCGHCVRKTDVVDCKAKQTWGSSFDDGPTDYTNELLQYLEAEKMKSTFFVVGSRVAYRPEHLQSQYYLGHTIGVHTWSHTALTSQSSEQIIAELGWTKKVIKDAIGVTPLYMRPPYGDIDDRVRAIVKAMNMTPVMWTVAGTDEQPIAFDTFDYNVPDGQKTPQESVSQFEEMLQAASVYPRGFIVLEHDLWWQQVKLAVGYFLPGAKNAGYSITSINQCMSQNLADMYVETSSTKGTTLPAGSGGGNDIIGTGQTAPKNSPLGGSDGSNIDPNVEAGGYAREGGGAVHMDIGTRSLVAGVVLSGLLTFIPALL